MLDQNRRVAEIINSFKDFRSKVFNIQSLHLKPLQSFAVKQIRLLLVKMLQFELVSEPLDSVGYIFLLKTCKIIFTEKIPFAAFLSDIVKVLKQSRRYFFYYCKIWNGKTIRKFEKNCHSYLFWQCLSLNSSMSDSSVVLASTTGMHKITHALGRIKL